MQVSTLIEVLTAAHLTAFVDAPPEFENRGGIMVVAPPGSLKSTIIKQLEVFPNAVVLSDINVRQLADYRKAISNRQYVTLAFTEVEKLYQRHDFTSSNIEGHIKGMCEEGFRHMSHEDHRMVVRPARCLVVGGMTDDLYGRKYKQWLADGFARRFIWCHYVLKDPRELMVAIHNWHPIEMIPDHLVFALPKTMKIPYDLADEDSRKLASWLRFYNHAETPYVLMKKIACVLKWRHKGVGHMDILKDFSTSLTKDGAELETAWLKGKPKSETAGALK